MEPPTPSAPPRRSCFRAFLPFLVTSLLGGVILCWDYHRRHWPETLLRVRVTLDGTDPAGGWTFTLDDRDHDLRRPLPLGSRRFRFGAADAEPVTLDRFVGYGPLDLGTVTLKRSVGSLTVAPQPRPDRIDLTGPHGQFRSETGVFAPIAAGDYTATLHYGGLTHTLNLHAFGPDQRLEPVVPIGVATLAAEPNDGRFTLRRPATGQEWTGTFPGGPLWLPAGDYELLAERGDYRLRRAELIRANTTNRITVAWVYGTLRLVSEPAGARVTVDGVPWGVTPLVRTNVPPGRYRVQFTRDDHDPEILDVEAVARELRQVSVPLVNTRHRQALADARADLAAERYGSAVRNLNEALRALPGETNALALLPTAKAGAAVQAAADAANRRDFPAALRLLDEAEREQPGFVPAQAVRKQVTERQAAAAAEDRAAQIKRAVAEVEEAVRNGRLAEADTLLATAKTLGAAEADLERLGSELKTARSRAEAAAAEQALRARRQSAGTAFRESAAKGRHAALFPVTELGTTQDLAAVEDALKRMLADPKCLWKQVNVGRPDATTRYVLLGSRGLAVDEAVLQFVEVRPGETQVRWQLRLFEPYEGNFGVPLSPQTFLNRPDYAREKVAEANARFRADLERQLGQPLTALTP